jgi:hypothetical protein
MASISQDDYLKDTSTFDYARKRASDQSAVNLQSRKDALARRFASLGNLDSGARLKAEEKAAQDETSNLTNANEGINAQQNAELGRRREVVQGQQFQAGESEKGRAFAGEQAALQRAYGTSERVAGQDFSAGQADIQRKFSTGERLSGQDFVALQAQLGRDFTTQEREALQKYQRGERLESQDFANLQRQFGQKFQSEENKKQRDLQKAQFEKTFGLSMEQFIAAKDQFEKTFGEEVRVNNANIDFAQQALDKKGFLENLGGLFDMKGVFGGGNSTLGQFGSKLGTLGGFVVGGPVGAVAGGKGWGSVGDKVSSWF